MYSQQITRIYFSRYFYTTFRSNLKCYQRVSKSQIYSHYLYSNTYNYNNFIKSSYDQNRNNVSFTFRSYVIPTRIHAFSKFYDNSWFHTSSTFKISQLIIFLLRVNVPSIICKFRFELIKTLFKNKFKK